MKIVLFAYDFPHRKTQDFMLRLFLERIPVDWVFAAPWRELPIPEPQLRSTIRHTGLMHPHDVASRLSMPYSVMPHEDIVNIIRGLDIDLGIIAGARILPKYIIDAFPAGILNFHPGLLPHARGLGALWTSLLNNIPLAVTAHLIDEYVDKGTIISAEEIQRFPDDTLFDLSERLHETQLAMLAPTIERIEEDYNARTI